MALTPEGTPYVEASDLVAAYPAASLSLANRVDLVGVLPFADSAARATAIPSPTDGQYSYLQDTNATEFWNGSAWVAAGTAPGLVHVNTTTFTSQSTVSIDSVFTATYENYAVIIYGSVTNDSNPAITMKLRASGTDSSANYVGRRIFSSATVVDADGGSGTSAIRLSDADLTSQPSFYGSSVFLRPFIADRTAVITDSWGGGSGGTLQYRITTENTAATAFDGFSLIVSAGNMTGNIRIYGYKNS